MNTLVRLGEHGQSVWLDYMRRSLVTSGELGQLIDEDGLKGLTSNPSIFQKAISGSTDYDEALRDLARRGDLDAKGIFERLAVHDIQMAADRLKGVYRATGGGDGVCSLEVSPELAHDTEGTCVEARRLWKALDRDNVMIKVPATPEGIPAIEQLTSEGLNINVTLLFARDVYERVVEAYIRGIERLGEGGGDVSRVLSVASFFVSRIDASADAIFDERLEAGVDPGKRELMEELRGRIAIANAKLAYQRYKELFSGERWQRLVELGARTQRLLWASTSTKNPEFRDVLYVEELIGPNTVTTLPPATLDAFRDHGMVDPTLEQGVDRARADLERLETLGVSLSGITDKLLAEGVESFADAFRQLLEAVEEGCKPPAAKTERKQTYSLPDELRRTVDSAFEEWDRAGNTHRLWARDASLWTGEDEADWLGWLGVTEDQVEQHLDRFRRLARWVREGELDHVVLLGMGGSSLCAEVLAGTFGPIEGFPHLHVLDSTDPAQVKALEDEIDLERTLFVVSSKSGTTLETSIFMEYFFDRVQETLGEKLAGSRFIAVTDPGSPLQQVAEQRGFRRVFPGVPSIGGRYSALSDFGMVPAAAMGLDVARLLDGAEQMVHACATCVPVRENPGVVLGTILGVLAQRGRDKVTLITTPGISGLGAWLEQLLAESTGKEGTALIPVDRETVGEPGLYGDDRLFIQLKLASDTSADQDAAIDRLERAGHPVARIELPDRYALGGEFFCWEFATAVAGGILEINPFDQPDVEASKAATKRLTSAYEETGELPKERPIATEGPLTLFADERNADELARAAGEDGSLAAYLAAHLARLGTGDYLAVLAYLRMVDEYDAELQALRHRVRDRRGVATCLGYGPRYLHSTGQAYKGGPDSGVFLQMTCEDETDLKVPGRGYTFGVVKAAQARGDLQVLAERGRRALRVHISEDVLAGLKRLRELVEAATI